MGLRTLLAIPCLGPYTVNVSGTSTTVNSNVLADSDESTGIDVDQYIGATGVFNNTVRGALGQPPAGTTVTQTNTTGVYARIAASTEIVGVNMQVFGTGNSSALDPTKPPIDSPLGTLYPMDSNGYHLVQNAIDGFTVLTTATVPANRTAHIITRVTELWIVVAIKRLETPPRRLYPRGDGLGVGGGRRHWPPPASQQRGFRRGPGGFL